MDSGLVKVLRSCRRVYEQEHQHLSGADLEKGWKQYWNSIGAEVTGNFDSSKLANTANPLKRRASEVGRTSATKTLIRHGTGGQSPADAEIKALIRKGQQLHLPLMVEGEEYEAIPDTGCRVNIVHISVLVKAWKKGGRVTRSPQPLQSLSLRIANGDSVEVRGPYYLRCAFLDHPSDQVRQRFYAAKQLSSRISFLMGMEFLDRFQLLTSNSHRLVQQKPHREPVPRLLSAGAKCPQISLMLDGVQVVAQADTGSELDLIEKFFAQTNGFRTQDLNEDDPHETELFDGRRIPLVGKILVKVGLQQRSLFSHETAPNESTTQHVKEGKATVRQTLEIESPELPQERLFYISDGLRAVVVAGQELLHSMDAFKRCFLSGKSEDCATPIFKVRNKSIGPQPSPSK